MSKLKSQNLYFPYMLVTPAVVVTVLIVFIPIIETSIMSLFNYIIWKPKDFRFIFFANYVKALKDPVFWISLKNTVI
ncbi:MAG: sugar ABC transporter permease [Spirochaetales bacterium]|nr:sugar ABC transporter permease [Spirochaetales bacterium]